MSRVLGARKIGVFSIAERGGEPLATGVMVQPWMLLVVPPVDPLAALGERRSDGPLRVLVAPVDDLDNAVTGTVSFNDPLDQGLLAVVQLDRDVTWPFRPIPFAGIEDEETTVAAVHRHLSEPHGREGVPVPAPPPDPMPWPQPRPDTWPSDRSWPPAGGSPETQSGICTIIPCCWGCAKNPRC